MKQVAVNEHGEELYVPPTEEMKTLLADFTRADERLSEVHRWCYPHQERVAAQRAWDRAMRMLADAGNGEAQQYRDADGDPEAEAAALDMLRLWAGTVER